MPYYDYRCSGCNQVFEVSQSIKDDPLKECVLCKSTQVERLISAPNFLLNGGGWFRDGYGSTPSKVEVPKHEHKPADPSKATETKTYKKD